jgi:DNA-directed RNA polymerase specialized sigma24 family protein
MTETELTPGSVSGWIAKMREGDSVAIEQLVARYFGKITQFADGKLRCGIRVSDDGEDIANFVMQVVSNNVAKGCFPNLQDRDDLWFLMIAIAQNAVIDRQRTEMRRKRLASTMHTMTDLLAIYNLDLDDFLGKEDPQSKLLEIIDCWEQLLKSLPDERTRQVAQLKIQGVSNLEIASKLRVVERTVTRKLDLILRRWQDRFCEQNDN